MIAKNRGAGVYDDELRFVPPVLAPTCKAMVKRKPQPRPRGPIKTKLSRKEVITINTAALKKMLAK